MNIQPLFSNSISFRFGSAPFQSSPSPVLCRGLGADGRGWGRRFCRSRPAGRDSRRFSRGGQCARFLPAQARRFGESLHQTFDAQVVRPSAAPRKGAGARRDEWKASAQIRNEKSQRDLINQPSVERRSRPTLGGRMEMNPTLKGLNPSGDPVMQPRWGCDCVWTLTQGSACRATLG